MDLFQQPFSKSSGETREHFNDKELQRFQFIPHRHTRNELHLNRRDL